MHEETRHSLFNQSPQQGPSYVTLLSIIIFHFGYVDITSHWDRIGLHSTTLQNRTTHHSSQNPAVLCVTDRQKSQLVTSSELCIHTLLWAFASSNSHFEVLSFIGIKKQIHFCRLEHIRAISSNFSAMASMALPRVFVRNILARVADADLWALLRGFSLEYSVTKIHPVRKPPAQNAADSPMLVYFECRDDSSCSALIPLLDGQHFPGICKYALKAEMATPRLERQSASKSMANGQCQNSWTSTLPSTCTSTTTMAGSADTSASTTWSSTSSSTCPTCPIMNSYYASCRPWSSA